MACLRARLLSCFTCFVCSRASRFYTIKQLQCLINSVLIVVFEGVSNISIKISHSEKQQPEVFYKNRCSEKIPKTHKKTPASESLF